MKIPLISVVGVVLTLGLVPEASAQKVKAVSCGSDVALSVTVFGSRTAPGGYALVSDGLGTYQGGAKGSKVSAIFQVDNCTHDFTLNLHTTNRKMWALLGGGDIAALFFNFDRIHSVPLTTSADFLTSKFCTDGVSYGADGKIAKNSDGAYQDNYAGCDVDETGAAFVRRGGGVTLDGDERLAFHKSGIDQPLQGCAAIPDAPECSASYIRVYHPDATTWILRAEPAAIASHRVWAGGSAGYAFIGYETVPLEIVVKKQ
jgi:hypothetical protein